MADASRGGNALGWVVLGFLAGVAATLGVFAIITPSHAGRGGEAAEAPSAAPAPRLSEQTVRKAEPAKLPPSAAPAPAVAANATDQQVQEDAAAAGMTSRRAASSAPAPVPN